MARPSEPVSTDNTWGPYRGLFRFAAGGMAEVWVAAKRGHAGFEKLVAVKRMLPTLDEERFVTMFLDEAQVAAHVRSPHVVSTIDLGRADDGSLYIVMELVRGASLSHLMAQARQARMTLPAAVVVEILAQACRGLHDAHEATTPVGLALEIVHRDISPQNLLVDTAGVVRVTDFGVARAVERFSRTSTGEVRGKVGYFSPEQAEGGPVDRRTDLFALGVVAHELVTGERLFRADTAIRTVQNVLTAPIPPLVGHGDITPALEAVLLRALARDPDARWQTARELGEALVAAHPRSGPDAVATLLSSLAAEHLEALDTKIRDAYVRGETAADLADDAPEAPSVSAPLPATPRRGWGTLVATAVVAALGAAGLVLAFAPLPEGGPDRAAPDAPSIEPSPVSAPPPDPVAEPPPSEPATVIAPEAEAEDPAPPVAARGSRGRRASPPPPPVAPPTRTTPLAQPPPEPATPAPPPPRGSSVLFGADTFETELGEGGP